MVVPGAKPGATDRDHLDELGDDEGEKAPGEEEPAHPKAPWHFKVLVVGSVIYLGYRLYQGIGWLIHHV